MDTFFNKVIFIHTFLFCLPVDIILLTNSKYHNFIPTQLNLYLKLMV